MTPFYDFVSVSLEIIAFFFVTIDLYGRKRLQSASEALISLTRRGSGSMLSYLHGAVRIEMLGVNILEGLPVLGTVFLFVAMGLSGFLVGYIGVLLGRHAGQAYAAASGLLVYLGFSSGLFFSTMLILYGLCGTVVLLNRVIQRIEFEGILLGVGAVLFVIAKGMIWVHLFGEVW